MSRVALLAPSLLPILLTLACSAEDHAEHRGPEFHFGAAPAPAVDHAPPGDQPADPDLEAGAEAGAEAEPEPETPIEVRIPGVGDDGNITFAVDWFEGSLEQAKAKAKAEAKLVFVDVGAYWCPPCHELDEKVFTQRAFGDWLGERMIAVHIDAEKGEGPEIVERYHVQAYPTMLVLEPSGIEKGRIIDFVEPEPLIEQLGAIAAGGNVLAALEDAARADPDAIEARYQLAHAYTLAARREEADSVFARVIAADPENKTGLTSKVFYDRTMFFTLKLDNDPETAIAELEALQHKYPDSAEAVKAYRIIGRAACKLGRPDDAVAALEAMIATDPTKVSLKASYGWFAFRENCRPDAGLAAVLAGIEQAPEDAELRYLEAELRRLLDQPAAALVAIRKASELEPDSAYYKRQVRRFADLADADAGPR